MLRAGSALPLRRASCGGAAAAPRAPLLPPLPPRRGVAAAAKKKRAQRRAAGPEPVDDDGGGAAPDGTPWDGDGAAAAAPGRGGRRGGGGAAAAARAPGAGAGPYAAPDDPFWAAARDYVAAAPAGGDYYGAPPADEDDDVILIASSSDDEEGASSGDERDRAALRRIVQSEDPRFRAALAAAQAAFAGAAPDGEVGWGADAAAGGGGAGGAGDWGAGEGLGSTFRLPEGAEGPDGPEEEGEEELERVLLVGVALKGSAAAAGAGGGGGGGAAGPRRPRRGTGYALEPGPAAAEAAAAAAAAGGWARLGSGYSIDESLAELGRLAETAGLKVVGSTYQVLEAPSNATYIGSGKVGEVARAVAALKADTVIFDDELSPGQLRNLEKAFTGQDGRGARVGDRTALILDIFSQRARTREGMLQVALAQTDYQLPRLTRMWTHLDRVGGGGRVKGAGEKQIEIDKRLLRDRAAALRRELQEVRRHRAAHRERRGAAPIPVVALVGYTNAGKSTLLNTLTQAGVLAEDRLFATLDPTTRKVRLRNNLEVLFSDTVGFIQKLPPQLVAAFAATLEEIADAACVVHVLDASAPNAAAQCDAVLQVLDELGVHSAPIVTAWNKADAAANPDALRALAAARPGTVVMSGATGEGVDRLLEVVGDTLAAAMEDVQLLLPYASGDLLEELHRTGRVESVEYEEAGVAVRAAAPRHMLGRLRQFAAGGGAAAAAAGPRGEGPAAAGAVIDAAGDGADGGGSDWEWEEGGLSGAEDGAWDEDEEVAAARRHLEEGGFSRAAADAAPKRAAGAGAGAGRRRRGGDAAAAEAARRRLMEHRLPAGWDEAIYVGRSAAAAAGGAGSEAAAAAGARF
ncbi:hypothetical protein Rsub_06421 [Raphidocelis subcapitata]|uniref:Hflx-type G domain-containing protein n=1 Tax=Raphidocelis subcapitata TaxID=307507 RepID=A0A2V0P691_9CHLO|nr:hypothetical protein Rsub_06421 [Raphidocelis subcapitata]|eukprot:GBF93383.1 hypothetical protein Rsub_06421 [Raphidocelis subcapitata]